MKAVVLHGKVLEGAGWDEQDVFVQAFAVSQALADLGYEPIVLSLSLNIAETVDTLLALRPAFVFNLVEAIEGRGNMIHAAPALLDALHIPYTGAQTEGIFLTSSKITAKKILRAHGIATPGWFSSGDRGHGLLPGDRCIVKSGWEDASIGLDEDSVVPADDFPRIHEKIADLRKQLGGACFAEVFIEGREINVSLLAGEDGPEILPPAEIIFADYPPDKIKVLGYRSKWIEDSFEYRHTPRTFDFPGADERLLAELSDIARQTWEIFSLRGYARVDFRVDRTGKPWVLEINANPCLSPEGGFIAAVKQAGIDYNGAIERIIGDMPAVGGNLSGAGP
ncbi:MAG: D-alanine--D-alanine ligase [Syntrophobacteraceae bacterium CG23_combo_of_CG06-09_8_20_14_all_50_8]|nr:MAG: D-alanine--D-alanine ligase [Syntrophobacteraceae bacterium CG23_combo_of_CG06-09_8_20_14_all_50_8]